MNENVCVSIDSISKVYQLSTYDRNSFRHSIANLLSRKQFNDFYALKDISLEINVGDKIGIIGGNGAGKSTLLKILSKITKPSSGRIKIKGKVASLLEVGTGFHPELTGLENIYLNGALLGMHRQEIKKKLDEIINFSGVEKFLNMPVKHYSSGMYVRLAFSVAAHLDADILLIDEVLAVGDTEFQNKCIGKMNTLHNSGRTLILISHDLNLIDSITTKCFYLEKGSIVAEGKSSDVINKYLNKKPDLTFDGPLSQDFNINDLHHNSKSIFEHNYIANNPSDEICISVNIKTSLINLRLYLSIYTSSGIRLFTLASKIVLSNETETITFYIKPYLLRPGKYKVAFGGITEEDGLWFWNEFLYSFDILPLWDSKNVKINEGLINYI